MKIFLENNGSFWNLFAEINDNSGAVFIWLEICCHK